VTNLLGESLEGFDFEYCLPITGDSTDHGVRWRGDAPNEPLTSQLIRLRVQAHRAKVYALSAGRREERAAYWQFTGPAKSNR
jgi:hypothetical protein